MSNNQRNLVAHNRNYRRRRDRRWPVMHRTVTGVLLMPSFPYGGSIPKPKHKKPAKPASGEPAPVFKKTGRRMPVDVEVTKLMG